MINTISRMEDMGKKLKNKKNIVLIGMMGCGKSSVAKAISALTEGFTLLDIDEQIEKEQETRIAIIFKTRGEGHFRDLETQSIQKHSNTFNNIIATGGGAVENLVNLQNLQRNSIIFYLCANPNELYERVKDDTNRPLLKDANARKEFDKLLLKREKNYNRADYKIITSGKTIEQIANEIIEKYLEYEEKYS